MLRELKTNEMEKVSGGINTFVLNASDLIGTADAYTREWGDWMDEIDRYQDILWAQSENADLTDGVALAFIDSWHMGIDTNADGSVDVWLNDGDIIEGVDADNNGQVDILENAGLIAQDSIIS